ncbi:unnamed protein product [Phytophthora fragariaefolia]|uniref:Unnamed protein product n=1 Tax=Phytophthora fragariaefolia TaxID=1490495 RepID=A0A9W6XQD6_9STRA|nr:unnamed protein product [Phytophthora fragariaefolia]
MRESDIPLTAVKIPFLGCSLGKDGVCADPEKVCAIAQWPVPVSQKDLRKWLGLANYLYKHSANYADMARPLTNLLKKDAVWSWTSETQQTFEAIKSSLQSVPSLALPDDERPFSVVCDASDFALGYAPLQVDVEGRERVVSFQSRGKEPPCPRQGTFGDEVCLGQDSGAPVSSKTLCDLHRSCLVEDGDVVASPLSAHGAVAFFLRRVQLYGGIQAGKAECPGGRSLSAARICVGASGLPGVTAL